MNQSTVRQPAQPSRIHIIGSPGSGKSTLARALHIHLQIPWYELDLLAYEGGYGPKIALDARLASVQHILAQPHWITEGTYLGWTNPLFDHADQIVWLDLPIHLNSWRIVHRHVVTSRVGANRLPNTRVLIHFLWRTIKSRFRWTPRVPTALDDDSTSIRINAVHFLRSYQHKVVHCRRPADVAHFQNKLLPRHSENL